ncbi:Transcriptional activator FeaR [Corynebacterium occultum]|uniref:Transcriptional activator FeaR n=1 Tax=Corynebacterium occultum TaxID=2675219 RepID=A0A6B8W3U2_9CORY|nr:helix-turn-helix domain-containing protein [Corynebacterium occultum]QGU06597.1 Transcriptional activator FeaR [Corynebacterium occultum]
MSELHRTKYEESFSISKEGLEKWKACVAKVFPPLRIAPTERAPFAGSLRAAGAVGLHMSRISSSPHIVERRQSLISGSDGHYLKLSLHLQGQSMLVQDGRELLLQPGDVTLYDTSRPYTLVQSEDYTMLVAMFPREAVRALAPDAPELAGLKLEADSGLTSIVSDYLHTLDKNLLSLNGPAGQRLARAGLDLIGSLLATELDQAPAAEPHALTLRKIQNHIEQNLADPELSPTSIAAAHYISVRHLHDLFRQDGRTVAAWVRSQRLERCRQDLRDPLLMDRNVAGIAARWGFLDAGHFSRLFRTTFGETPSNYRKSASHTPEFSVHAYHIHPARNP